MLPLAFALGGTAAAATGDPLPGLSPGDLQRFTDGRAAFATVEDVADGLGPVFNGTSCGGCHRVGGIGGGSETVETRFGTTSDGVFDPMTAHGGSLIQTNGIGAQGACDFTGEVVPPQATIVAGRRTTPLFGLGLVDAVPDATFMMLAEREARRHAATAGRPNLVTDVVTGQVAVGRFGWKSQVPNLLQFSGDAYLNEMGITTPLFPDESCPQGDCGSLACDPVPGVDDATLDDIEAFRDFMTLLAPPPQLPGTMVASRRSRRLDARGAQSFDPAGGRPSDTGGGSRVFEQIGCADCHVPSLRAGPSAVAAIDLRAFQPYSDFLLHDVGSLGDGIAQGQATGTEMRTAPLWGLHLLTTYLHDGRARTIDQAILAHDGQARGARDRFAALPPASAAALLAFLGAL